MKKILRNLLIVFFLFAFSNVSSYAFVQATDLNRGEQTQGSIPHEEIIQKGLHACQAMHHFGYFLSNKYFLQDLEQWYNKNPFVDFASLVDTSITVKFVDGSYLILMDATPEKNFMYSTINSSPSTFSFDSGSIESDYTQTKTTVILNPTEYVYGYRHCEKIMHLLMKKGYAITYRANTDVDLPYLRCNLTADILYMDTHAGYWDLDGDHQSDAVVIASGEAWTNETPQQYPFEYANHFIVEGVAGEHHFIAFTPAFIDYYYTTHRFPDTLVYMATCYATYDASMAQAFLTTGAAAYVGWSQNTVFWTNSRTSVLAFRLFTAGWTTKQVCTFIGSGGFYNWLFHSKLVFFGDGTHTIP